MIENTPALTNQSLATLERPNSDPAQRAFTLVELLATVVTITCLFLALLPALAKSSNSVTRTVCINNLRQLGGALLTYTADNRDYLPYPNWGMANAGWLFTPNNGVVPTPSAAGYASGQLFRYIRESRSYTCPADMESKYYGSRQNKLSSYVMNGAVCGYGTTMSAGCKITEVWNSECYLLWNPDESAGSPPIGPFAFNDASSYPDGSEGMGRLHSAQSSEILTVGGQVRIVPVQKTQQEQSSTKRSLAWWSPFSTNGR